MQIISKGVEDVFLQDDSDITFFKTVFRRHTNFSRTEINMNFTNGLDFGTEGVCRIKKFGDLMHRLFLVMKLPAINLVYRHLIMRDVINIFAAGGIDIVAQVNFLLGGGIPGITTPIPLTQEQLLVIADALAHPGLVYTPTLNILFQLLIKGLNTVYGTTLAQVSQAVVMLEPGGSLTADSFFATTGGTNEDVTDYINFVISGMMELNQVFKIEYLFVLAQSEDMVPPRLMANADEIKEIMFQDFVAFATGKTDPHFDPKSFNSENLFFIFNVETANYNINSGTVEQNASAVFQAGIAAAYGGNTLLYTNLDAYDIFTAFLNQTSVLLNNNFDVQLLIAEIVTTIRFGLSLNIKLLGHIYNSLQDVSKFMFFRLFTRITPTTFDTNSQFQNVSLFHTTNPELNDNFTNRFIVPPEPHQPPNLYHPFSSYSQSAVNTMHVDNLNQFRSLIFTGYFNALNLWKRTDIKEANKCVQAITGSPSGTIPDAYRGIYFLNYIPFLMTTDIPSAILKILNQEKAKSTNVVVQQEIQNIINELTPVLNSAEANITTAITPKICIPNDFVTDLAMASFRTSPNDIIMTAIFRQGAFLKLGNNFLLLPDYILQSYQQLLVNFSSRGLPLYDTLLPLLQQVVDLFATEPDALPSFALYAALGFNQNSNILINTPTDILADAPSAIWRNLFQTVVDDYNDLYNNTVLGEKFFTNNVGAEMLRYLNDISLNYLNIDPEIPVPIDYYIVSVQDDFQKQLPVNGGPIGSFLANQYTLFKEQLAKFDANRGLLNMRNIFLPAPQFLYAQFNLIVTKITNIIETTKDAQGHYVYFHQDHGKPNDPVLVEFRKLTDPNDPNYNPNAPHINAMDIIDELNVLFPQLVTKTSNPFSPTKQLHLFELWNKIWLPTKSFNTQTELENYAFLYGTTTPEQFFQRNTLINEFYNGFANEGDEYVFLEDFAIDLSIAQGVPADAGFDVVQTNSNILNDFLRRQAGIVDFLKGLNSGISITLNKSELAGKQAFFAWIQKLGHYLIDSVTVMIGDQVIDKHYGEWLEIWHQLTKIKSKQRGYDNLIGNVKVLTDYNNKGKPTYEMIVPMQFWFCRNIGASLPLIALNHTFVEIRVQLKSLQQVSYFEPYTVFKRKPILTCNLLTEYIYVEDDERSKIATSKHEYLIDTLQFNNNLTINPALFNNDIELIGKLFFQNMVKELFWVIQDNSFIDGSKPRGQKKYDNYSISFVSYQGNPASMAKIQFNSRNRENYKDIKYYNFVQPYEKHYSSPETGINIYSFSINPEMYQPQGAADYSMLDDSAVIVKLFPEIQQAVMSGSRTFSWRIYGTSYNILRIMSGLAGLAFYR